MENRCIHTADLEVHHRTRDGGDGLDNAIVLCRACTEALRQVADERLFLNGFDEEDRKAALRRAGHRCECTQLSCH